MNRYPFMIALLMAVLLALSVALSTVAADTPPEIIIATRPALLVTINGPPEYVSVKGSSPLLWRVANSRFLLLKDAQGKHYLHLYDGFLESGALDEPWRAVEKLPKGARIAEKSARASRTTNLLEGEPDPKSRKKPSIVKSVTPWIYVSQVPAELIVTTGEPDFISIPGTILFAARNTTGNLFWHQEEGSFYLLSAGVWFSAEAYQGPWTMIPADKVPIDFRMIPDTSTKKGVKAFLPPPPKPLAFKPLEAETGKTWLDRLQLRRLLITTVPATFPPAATGNLLGSQEEGSLYLLPATLRFTADSNQVSGKIIPAKKLSVEEKTVPAPKAKKGAKAMALPPAPSKPLAVTPKETGTGKEWLSRLKQSRLLIVPVPALFPPAITGEFCSRQENVNRSLLPAAPGSTTKTQQGTGIVVPVVKAPVEVKTVPVPTVKKVQKAKARPPVLPKQLAVTLKETETGKEWLSRLKVRRLLVVPVPALFTPAATGEFCNRQEERKLPLSPVAIGSTTKAQQGTGIVVPVVKAPVEVKTVPVPTVMNETKAKVLPLTPPKPSAVTRKETETGGAWLDRLKLRRLLIVPAPELFTPAATGELCRRQEERKLPLPPAATPGSATKAQQGTGIVVPAVKAPVEVKTVPVPTVTKEAKAKALPPATPKPSTVTRKETETGGAWLDRLKLRRLLVVPVPALFLPAANDNLCCRPVKETLHIFPAGLKSDAEMYPRPAKKIPVTKAPGEAKTVTVSNPKKNGDTKKILTSPSTATKKGVEASLPSPPKTSSVKTQGTEEGKSWLARLQMRQFSVAPLPPTSYRQRPPNSEVVR